VADTHIDVQSMVASAISAAIEEVDFLVPGILAATALLMVSTDAAALMARMFTFNALIAVTVAIAIVFAASAFVFPINRILCELFLKRFGVRWLVFRIVYPYMFPDSCGDPGRLTGRDYRQHALNSHLGAVLHRAIIEMPESERKHELIRRKRVGRLLRGLWVPLLILIAGSHPLLLALGSMVFRSVFTFGALLIAEAVNDALIHSIAMKASTFEEG
jgi:hypothetical protein